MICKGQLFESFDRLELRNEQSRRRFALCRASEDPSGSKINHPLRFTDIATDGDMIDGKGHGGRGLERSRISLPHEEEELR